MALLTLVAFLVLPSTASAAMERPVWTAGDYWIYDFNSTAAGSATVGTLRMDVTGTETVTVNGTSYATYHLDATVTIPFGSLSFTLPADLWFSVDTLAIVRLTGAVNITIGNLSAESTFEVSGNPPQTINWPLTAGDTWTSSTIVWAVATATNGTVQYSSQSVTSNFVVLADETIGVPAGSFTTTPVRQNDPTSTSYTVNYWSPTVGHWARVSSYNNTGAEQSSFRLREYKYQGPGFFGRTFLGLPVFAWILLVVVVIVAGAAIAAVRRRQRPPPVQMPPSQQEMPPTESERIP